MLSVIYACLLYLIQGPPERRRKIKRRGMEKYGREIERRDRKESQRNVIIIGAKIALTPPK